MANIAGIMELYTAYFNRAADKNGVDYWANEMDANGWKLDDVAKTFALVPESNELYAGLTNAQVVAKVYTNVLNRAADPEGAAYWEAELESGNIQISQLIQAVVNAAKEDVDNLGDDDIVANKTAVSQNMYNAGFNEKNVSLATVTGDATSVTLVSENAYQAAYDSALTDYTTALTDYNTKKAAADTAALTVTSVAEANASKTAADAAATAAAALVKAAAAMKLAADATPSAVDNATAAANVATATAATTATTALVTTATTAVTTAQAAADAAAQIGETSALTVNNDTIFGTVKSDTINATQLTYNDSDVIADSSSIDSDTLNVSATGDITAVPTVVGIENVNFNITTADASGDAIFAVAATNISGASTITVAATKAVNSITSTSLTGVKSGITVKTALNSATVAAVNDADIVINMTDTDANTITSTGAIDTLVVNSAGEITNVLAAAEESLTINGEGKVTVNDTAANAAGTDVEIKITAKDDVTLTSIADTGNLTVTTTEGDITTGTATVKSDGNVTLTTGNGDIKALDVAAATGTVTLNATGDGDANVTGADGDVTVTTATAADKLNVTATGAISVINADSAKTVSLKAGLNSSSTTTGLAAVETLTLESSNADETVVFDLGTGSGVALKTVTVNGSNDVTLAMDAANLVTATGNTGFKITNAGTGAAKVRIDTAAAVDLAGHLTNIDAIVLGTDMGTNIVTVSSAQNIELGANTDVSLTAAAVAGNSVKIIVNDDTSGTDTTTYNIQTLTATNLATVTLELNDTEATVTATGAYNVDTANLVITGAGDLTVEQAITAASVNASTSTGDIKLDLITGEVTKITTGSGKDTFILSGTANADDYTIDGGAGIDTILVEADADLDANTVTLINIEKIDMTTTNDIDLIVRGADFNNQDLTIIGNSATLDTVTVNATVTTGESVSLENITASLVKLTLNGNTGGDTLVGSSTYATIIDAKAGNDTITATGTGLDIITGGAGDDTINITDANDAKDTVIFADTAANNGKDTITGFDINEDVLNFAAIALTGTENSVTATTASATDLANDLTIFSGINASTTSAITTTGTQTIADFTDLVDVAAWINEAGSAATSAKGVVVLNNGTSSYIYYLVNDGVTAAIASTDITLVGTVDAVVTTADTLIA